MGMARSVLQREILLAEDCLIWIIQNLLKCLKDTGYPCRKNKVLLIKELSQGTCPIAVALFRQNAIFTKKHMFIQINLSHRVYFRYNQNDVCDKYRRIIT
ncbi:hypothetical protein D3C76_1226520 [compost metagenome]